jgi:hypothetical protein
MFSHNLTYGSEAEKSNRQYTQRIQFLHTHKKYMKAKILCKGFSNLEDKGTTILTKRHAA